MDTALETRRIRLRPIERKDYPILHRWRNGAKWISHLSANRAIVGFDRFEDEMKEEFRRGRQLQFIIELKRTDEQIGTIFTHNWSSVDGYVFINTYVTKEFERAGHGAEASILLLLYMFDFFGVNKIYFEAFVYNDLSISTIRTAGLVEEGRFREHRFYKDERHDVLRFAIYRDGLGKFRRIIERLRRER